MSGHVRDWLPHGVVTRHAVRDVLERAVGDWAVRWFPERIDFVVKLRPIQGEARGDSDGSGWRVFRQAVAIGYSSWGGARLIERALDASVDPLSFTATDRHLVDAFERRLFEDLASTVEDVLGCAGELRSTPLRIREPFAGQGGVVVSLAEGLGPDLLSLAVPFAVILPLCKASLGPRTLGTARMAPLGQALSGVSLDIQATIGRAEIALTELKDLVPGDVLVLDARLEQPTNITLVNSDQVFARAKLANVGDGLALVFHA